MVLEKEKLTAWPRHLSMKMVRKHGIPIKDTIEGKTIYRVKRSEAPAFVRDDFKGYCRQIKQKPSLQPLSFQPQRFHLVALISFVTGIYFLYDSVFKSQISYELS
jgi:hypothetical protein